MSAHRIQRLAERDSGPVRAPVASPRRPRTRRPGTGRSGWRSRSRCSARGRGPRAWPGHATRGILRSRAAPATPGTAGRRLGAWPPRSSRSRAPCRRTRRSGRARNGRDDAPSARRGRHREEERQTRERQHERRHEHDHLGPGALHPASSPRADRAQLEGGEVMDAGATKKAGPSGRPSILRGAAAGYSKRRRARFVTSAPASTGRNARVIQAER